MTMATVQCQCGCGESFEVLAYRVKGGGAKYKNLDHRANAMRKPDAKRPGQGAQFRSIWRETGINIRRLRKDFAADFQGASAA